MSDPYVVRDEDERITVRVLLPRWLRWLAPVVIGLSVVELVVVFARSGGLHVVSATVLLAVALLAVLRRTVLRSEYVVDAFGVDKPRRGRRWGWADVAYVEKPGPFHDVVVLGLTEGGTARTMFPARLSSRFAELGRVPLRD